MHILIFFRRETRQEEIKELTSQGKIPHDVELEKHPEKSLEGRMCMLSQQVSTKMVFTMLIDLLVAGLMGKVAGSINVSSSMIYTEHDAESENRTSNQRKKCTLIFQSSFLHTSDVLSKRRRTCQHRCEKSYQCDKPHPP